MKPYIELLQARIDSVAPGIKIVPAASDLGIADEEAGYSGDGSELRVGLKALGSFLIRKDLSQATYWLHPDLRKNPKSAVAAYSALATILYDLSGHLTFHANGLSFAGTSYALLGDSGRGKSSLTLYALMNRHRLIGDDTVAVTADGRVTGGRPFLHLTPATVQALLPRLPDRGRKEFFLLSALGLEPVLADAPPLSRIYMLEPGEVIAVEPCTDLPRLLLTLLKSSGTMAALVKYDPKIVDRLLALMATVGVVRLIYPRRWDYMPHVLATLETDLSHK